MSFRRYSKVPFGPLILFRRQASDAASKSIEADGRDVAPKKRNVLARSNRSVVNSRSISTKMSKKSVPVDDSIAKKNNEKCVRACVHVIKYIDTTG